MPEFVTVPAARLSDDFFRRVAEFYVQQQPVPLSGIWQTINDHFTVAVNKALKGGDPADIRSALEQAYSLGLQGIDCPGGHTADWPRMTLAAATALGVLPQYHGGQPEPLCFPAPGLFDAMEEVAGAKITHPGLPGLRGARVGDRFVPYKLIEAVASMSNVVRQPHPWGTVLEIGGGAGFVCYWLCCVLNPPNYHLVDLTPMAVMQAFFLATAFGEGRVWLKGEKLSSQHSIFIHGPHSNLTLFPCIGLALNQNSLPEMVKSEQDRHMTTIIDNLLPRGLFFSQNHESGLAGQRRVFAVMQKHPELNLVSRSPAWNRYGYVDELWIKV